MSRILIVLIGLVLAGCSSSDKPAETAVAAPPPPQKTAIDAQLKALDKAKAVQGVIDKDAADKKKQIDDAGG